MYRATDTWFIKVTDIKQDLLKKLRNGEYESVVVYKLDRWARSSTELILEVQELIDKKIGFLSVSDNLDFNSSMGKLHVHILVSTGRSVDCV